MFIFFPPSLVSSCWLSYTNNLIWIFAAFMAFVEVVSLQLVNPSHFPFSCQDWPLVEIVSLVPMLITKRKAYFCFLLPGSKLTTFPTPFTPTMYSALLVLATSTLPTFDIPCLFQLNISILVRVIKEMTTLVQPMGEDNHIKQIRLDLKFAVSEIF